MGICLFCLASVASPGSIPSSAKLAASLSLFKKVAVPPSFHLIEKKGIAFPSKYRSIFEAVQPKIPGRTTKKPRNLGDFALVTGPVFLVSCEFSIFGPQLRSRFSGPQNFLRPPGPGFSTFLTRENRNCAGKKREPSRTSAHARTPIGGATASGAVRKRIRCQE
jgi:hypothetical protein